MHVVPENQKGEVPHLLSATTTLHSQTTNRHILTKLFFPRHSDSQKALSSNSWHLPQLHLQSFQTDPYPGRLELSCCSYDEDKVDKSLGSPARISIATSMFSSASQGTPQYHTIFPRMPLLYMHRRAGWLRNTEEF